jgi:hypothetical protein
VFVNDNGNIKGEVSLAGMYLDEVVNGQCLFADRSALAFALCNDGTEEDGALVIVAPDHEQRQQWIESIKVDPFLSLQHGGGVPRWPIYLFFPKGLAADCESRSLGAAILSIPSAIERFQERVWLF